MKDRYIEKNVLGFILLLMGGCVDPYRPAVVANPDSYLVVNGYFDSTPGATSTIRLSRTQNLLDTKAPAIEAGAKLTIESSRKAAFPLTETAKGTYTLSGVQAVVGDTYRLHIQTAAGGDYYSDFVPVVNAPAIDSVSWETQQDGVQLYVNTHDPANNTRYYRWEYDETWAYTSAYYSLYELVGNSIKPRSTLVFQCWNSAFSTHIQLAATDRLSQDVVSRQPLRFIDSWDMRFQQKYSILVRQFALTKLGYEYYQQLARISQNIGSLFDPQPGQVTGNFYSAKNPNELVLGFFQVGSVTQKRIFISSAQLPNWRTATGFDACVLDTMSTGEVIRDKPEGIIDEIGFPPSYLVTQSLSCVDCRTKGGTLTRPDFWK